MLTELLHGKETGTPDWVQQQMGHHFSGLSESDGLMILPECVVVLNYLAVCQSESIQRNSMDDSS